MILEYDEDTSLAIVEMKNPIRINEEIELYSFERPTQKVIIEKIYDPKDVEVEMANNTFFKYKLKMPFKVKKYEILRKPINK